MFILADAPSVSDVPATTLLCWEVMATGDGERHLVGIAMESGKGRVSTAVQSLDVRTLQATTSSGRAYTLRGEPGADALLPLWLAWTVAHGVTRWSCATDKVWTMHLRQRLKH